MSEKRSSLAEPNGRGEQGSAMLEFVLTIPVLLMIAGTTVDMARYMRYLQITTFVSQEAASQIYRQCSDVTIFNKPVLGSSQVAPNKPQTMMAIERCLERVQIQSQRMLNTSLGRAAMSAKVFRWQINQTSASADCGNLGSPSAEEVTIISSDGNLSPSITTQTDGGSYQYVDSYQYSLVVNQNPVKIVSSSDTGTRTPTILSADSQSALIRSQVVYQNNNIELTFPTGSGKPSRILTTREGLCTRGRVATVEVGFVFDPIVKFLPNLVTKLDTNAINREVSIF